MTKITARDIAKIANVSPSTVSRALNHRSSVNDETLQIIDQAMEKLGFKHQLEKKENTIIVNIEHLDNPFYSEIIKGINIAANQKNLHVLIDQTPLNDTNLADFIQYIETFPLAGLIVCQQLSKKTLTRLEKITTIVQCGEYNPDSELSYVSIDNYQTAKNATQTLINSGKKSLCLLNSEINNMYAYQRQLGFIDAVKENKLSLRQKWLVTINSVNFDSAIPFADQLLSSPDRPDAFLCVSDSFAASVLTVANKYHLKVPNDLAVIGFDNSILSKITTPPLSTINVPAFQEGYTSVELLVEKVKQQKILLKTELILRETI